MVITTHDQHIAATASRWVKMRDGRIAVGASPIPRVTALPQYACMTSSPTQMRICRQPLT
jgi:ABC-type lipoprotein export system ATPase subunit